LREINFVGYGELGVAMAVADFVRDPPLLRCIELSISPENKSIL
jgi:hypothetical protein